MSTNSIISHGLHVFFLTLTIILSLFWFQLQSFFKSSVIVQQQQQYGLESISNSQILLLIGKYLVILGAPMTFLHVCGLYRKTVISPLLNGSNTVPIRCLICFRVVTKGTFPALLRASLTKNLHVCQQSSNLIDHFMFEVVTDNEIFDLPESVRQVIVPAKYLTPHRTMFKARALNYALENDLNILKDGDWIFHLDEESVLSEGLLNGIVQFIIDQQQTIDRSAIGQGCIVYGKNSILNILTTVGEGFRVAIDYGLLRLCLKQFKFPMFLFKGSFVLCEYSVEKDVGFDFGYCGSLSEDIYFAISAYSKGFRFGWIDGELYEQAAFTFLDFFRQRKRWFCGINRVLTSTHLSFKFRLPFIYAYAISCLMTISIISNLICTVLSASGTLILPNIIVLKLPFTALCAINTYSFYYGSIKSINTRLLTKRRLLIAFCWVIVCPPFLCLVESSALIVSWFDYRSMDTFYVINKQIEVHV